MRRLFYMLGVAAAVVIVAGIIGLAVLFSRGFALDRESKAYADAAVRAIAEDWKRAELLDRATPELLEKAKPAEVDAWFANLSRLGRLVEIVDFKGQASMTYTVNSGGSVSANYLVDARFQNGLARFRISLVKRDGEWRIHGFFVDASPGQRKEQAT